MKIKDMEIGDWGYALYWAIDLFDGKPIVNLNYDITAESDNLRTVFITKTEKGYRARNWKPQEEKPSEQPKIQIYTRKYVWTGATDDTIASIEVID